MLYSAEMELKDRIRHARGRRNLKLQQLADLLTKAGYKITSQAISQWEQGLTGPSRAKVTILEQILKTPQGWILDDDAEPLPPLEPDDTEIFLEQLLSLGKALPDSQRVAAIQVLKALTPQDPNQPKTRRRAS